MQQPALPRSTVSLASRNAPQPWSLWIRYWGVVAVWMVVISYLSTDAFSASNTNSYIDPVLRYLFRGITNTQIVLAHSIIRKSAHFSEFLILGLLAFWAARGGRSPRWTAGWMRKAMLVAAVWAIVDELHQALSIARTASMLDSSIDVAGAAAGQVFLYLRHLLKR